MNSVGTNTCVRVSGAAVTFKQRALQVSCILMSLIPRQPGYRQQCYKSEDPNGNGIGTETKRKVQYAVEMFTLVQDRDTDQNLMLPTTREGNAFTGVCDSVHNRPYGYSATAHPCYGMVGLHPTGMVSCFLLR